MGSDQASDKDLARIVELTESILACALGGEWDKVNNLQIDQGRQIRDLFAEPIDWLNDCWESIYKIQVLMHQIIHLAEAEKAAIGEQLCCFKKVESVNKAYLRNTD
ncbi:MAG: hypothetical protein Kow0065_10650 [Methylomicrobium sp.]